MKWIKEIMEKHVNEDGVLNLEAAEKELNAEANKYVVPKEQYNNKVTDLKKAETTLKELQNDVKSTEELQEQLETEKKLSKKIALESALNSVNAIDIPYFVDKLSEDLELDAEGKLVGFDEQIKTYQEKHPALFSVSKDKTQEKDDLIIIDNKLTNGSDPKPLTREEIHEKYPGHQNKTKRMELIRELEGNQ